MTRFACFHRMSRRAGTGPAALALLFAAWCGTAAAAEQTPAAGSRPNVIFLLLDDAGWTDSGGFSGRMLTPHLDRLGAEGMRFTDAHSPAPNCSPKV